MPAAAGVGWAGGLAGGVGEAATRLRGGAGQVGPERRGKRESAGADRGRMSSPQSGRAAGVDRRDG